MGPTTEEMVDGNRRAAATSTEAIADKHFNNLENLCVFDRLTTETIFWHFKNSPEVFYLNYARDADNIYTTTENETSVL